jgi:hypothetical protein
MKNSDKTFIAEVYSLIVQIEELIKKYKYEDKVMSAIMIGLLDPVDLSEDVDEVNLKSVFSYNLESSDELEIVKELMTAQFDGGEEDDLDDLLRDLGISMN